MNQLSMAEQIIEQPQASLSTAEIKRKSVGGAVSYFGRTIFLLLINLVTMFVLSGKLTPNEFGIYGIVLQFVGLLIFVSDVGLAAALIQKKEEPKRNELLTCFTVQQILSWIIVALCAAVIYFGWLSQKTGPEGNWILLVLALSFPLAGLKTIPSILLERKLEYSKLVIPQIVETVAFNVILIWLVFTDNGVLSYTWAIAARSVVGVITMYLIRPWMPGFGLERSTWHLFRFGVAFQLNDLLARFKDQFFYLVLAYYLPLHQFGYIQWSKNWSMYPYNLTVQNVMAITFPTFSRIQDQPKLLSRAIEKTLYFISLAIFPILVGMSIFIYPLIALVGSYEKWTPAVLTLILFCFSVAWSALSTPMTNVLNAIGKINLTLKLMLMWTALTWILTPILVYFMGYEGVAWAAAVIALSSVIPIILVQRMIPFRFWDQIWRQLCGALIMLLVAYLGLDRWAVSFAHLFAGMFLAGVTYAAVTIALGPRKWYDEVKSLR